jgi:hypothetical protein
MRPTRVLRFLRALALAVFAATNTAPAFDGPSAPAPARRQTPPPPAQKPVDYRNPAREYRAVRVGRLTVSVENQLLTDAPETARLALARLERKVGEALEALPEPARAELRRIPLFLMYGPKARGGGRDNGLEYFQKDAPGHNPQIDPRWGHGVVVYCAENYVKISEFWALKALVHEFAHAYQLAHWPEDQPDIVRAWENANARGLYRDVKDDQGKTLPLGYAAVNQLEYFAELSCMYFVGCNYHPSDRAELEAYDPEGWRMVRAMWGLRIPRAKPRPTGARKPPT